MGDLFHVHRGGLGLLSAVISFLSIFVKEILRTYMLQGGFVPDRKFGSLQLKSSIVNRNLWVYAKSSLIR